MVTGKSASGMADSRRVPGVVWRFPEEGPLTPAFLRTGGPREGAGGAGAFLRKQAGPHDWTRHGGGTARSVVLGEGNEGTDAWALLVQLLTFGLTSRHAG
jgi:hypothetical protein